MSTQLGCERKHSQAWLLWVQTRCPYGRVQDTNLQQQRRRRAPPGLLLRWSEWGEPLSPRAWKLFSKPNVRLPRGLGRRNPGRLCLLKIKLLRSPHAWRGQWMWFSMTPTYQNSLTMTGISRCDFDTSQYQYSFWWSLSSRRPAVTRGLRWW